MKAQTKNNFITSLTAAGIALLAMPFVSSASQASNRPVFMPPGDSAPPPSGWLQFCLTYRAICKTTSLPAREVTVDEQAWHQLKRINDWVNHNVAPMTDMAHYGMIQWWRYPDDGAGACHSYALLKRRLLMEAGWPRQALLMTVVRDHDGEGHAVLTVKTSKGDFILDNLTDKIRLWSETGYQYVEIQSQSDPNQWVWAADPHASSAMHPGRSASEEVSIQPKPVEWPAWSSLEITDSSEQSNLEELPATLANEVADRIKLARARAAMTEAQGRPADHALAATPNHTLTADVLPDSHMPTAEAASDNHTPTAEALPGNHTATSDNDLWGVQLIGGSSEGSALAAYRHLQETYSTVLGSRQPLIISTNVGVSAHWYRVRVAANDRQEAASLCDNLRAAGGSCLVQRE